MLPYHPAFPHIRKPGDVSGSLSNKKTYVKQLPESEDVPINGEMWLEGTVNLQPLAGIALHWLGVHGRFDSFIDSIDGFCGCRLLSLASTDS